METTAKTLKIEQTREGEILTCKLAGWLDPNTSSDLFEKIDLTGVKSLFFDMKNVEYVFSSGIRAFLILQKQLENQGGAVKLLNVSDDVRNIFEYTGLESMLQPKS